MSREATPEEMIAELDRVAEAMEDLMLPGEAVSCAVKRLADAQRVPLVRSAIDALEKHAPPPHGALLYPDRRQAEAAQARAGVNLCQRLSGGATLHFLHCGPHLQREVQGMEFVHVGIAEGCDDTDAKFLRSRQRA